MLAGNKDALALLGLSSGLAATLPWFATNPSLAMALLSSAAFGAGYLTHEYCTKKANRVNKTANEGFILKSDDTLPSQGLEKGMSLGLTQDKNEEVYLPNEFLMRHTSIVGQSGVGKTTIAEYLLWQQISRGGGFIFIDAKLDLDTRDRIAHFAKIHGRLEEFYVLNLASDEASNTYNPIISGDQDEVASRLLNLIPSTENNPGADHYRQSAAYALSTIVGALQATRRTYTFGDLSLLLQSSRALERLERMTPSGPERKTLQIFLDQYRTHNKNGGLEIDIKRLKDLLGGIAGRISMFASGTNGKIFNTYTPEIDLFDIITGNKMLYVMLPTMAKDNHAKQVGKMVISDFRSAVAKVQALPKYNRPEIPFVALFDEMGSYVMDGVARLFEQARAAHIAMIPAFQSFSQLNEVSRDFSDMIIQNTWSKIYFKFGSRDSSETAAEIIGKEKGWIKTIGSSYNQATGSDSLRITPGQNEGDGAGRSEAYREQEEYRVSADHLKRLGIGEAIVTIGAKTYHVRTPMLTLASADIESFSITRHNPRIPKGLKPLNFETEYTNFVQKHRPTVLAQR